MRSVAKTASGWPAPRYAPAGALLVKRHAHAALIVVESVRSWQAGRRQRRAQHPEAAGVGALIGQYVGAHGEDGAVVADGELHIVPLLSGVHASQQVLAARFDPLDWPPESTGQERQDNLFGIDVLFDAKAAADVWCDHSNRRPRQPQDDGQ